MESEYENLRVEVDGAVATLTIDRPKVLNALDEATTAEITAAVDTLDGDDHVRAIIVTGAGDKAFVAGADIRGLAAYGAEEGRRGARAGQHAFDRIEQAGKPVIAAINGYALGGGCELALACHLRYASDRARLGLPEINLSIIPGHGGTQRLPRLIGRARALDLICTGRQLDADEALALGLVNRVIAHDDLLPTVRELADELATKPPLAMRYALSAVREGLEVGVAEGQVVEAGYFGLCCATEDKNEGMSAFLEKRRPEWSGR